MKIWLSLLGICLLLGGLLSGTHVLTKATIDANRSAAQRAILVAQVAPQQLPATLAWQDDYLPICQQLTLERLHAIGYGGPISLLLTYQRSACSTEQSECAEPTLRNIVVSEHAETPGIGDFFETTHPDWLQQFRQLDAKQLQDTVAAKPPIDSISGATITVSALRNAIAAALNVGTAIPFAGNACDPPLPVAIKGESS